MLESFLLLLLELEWILLYSHIFYKPLFGEVVTVIDEALSRVKNYVTATDEVFRLKKIFLLQGHAGVVGVDWLFGQLTSL
jgi:hypothetical protein